MPILIEKSRGLRTCRVINNASNSPPTTLEDLIEALKGLTFKIECKITDIVSDKLSEKLPDKTPDQLPDDLPEKLADKLSEKTPHQISEKLPERLPEKLPERLSERLPERLPGRLPEKLTEKLPEKLLERLPEKLPERLPEKLPERLPEKLPERLPERLPEKLETKPIPQPTVSPRITLPKQGSLTVGDLLNTTCIAVDDREEIPLAYIAYSKEKLLSVANRLSEISISLESMRQLEDMRVGDVVYAKSNDDNQWYRGMIEDISLNLVSIFFFDWGLREQVTKDRLRKIVHADLDPNNQPACAIAIKFSDKPGQAIHDFLKCELDYRIMVESFDKESRTYEVTVLPN